jgi:hypothetical protein
MTLQVSVLILKAIRIVEDMIQEKKRFIKES